jgi:uncharacterized protein (DUF305 family)
MKTLAPLLSLLAITTFAFAADEKKPAADHHSMSPMAHAIMGKTGAEFEAAYLGMMTLHHQGGGKMWALVREKATSEELKALEKKTTPKEQKEIEQMTGWLKQWHSKTPNDFEEPAESKRMMEKDMAELRAASGKEFDQLFAKKMAHHHMGAIEMGKLGAEKAQHDEVKKSAQEIADAQTKDREKLLSLAKEKP